MATCRSDKEPYLLIGRIHGSSSSRRQRAFATIEDRDRALDRWRTEGFTVFWAADNDGDLVAIPNN